MLSAIGSAGRVGEPVLVCGSLSMTYRRGRMHMRTVPVVGVSHKGCSPERPQNQQREKRCHQSAPHDFGPINPVPGLAGVMDRPHRHRCRWYRFVRQSSITCGCQDQNTLGPSLESKIGRSRV